MFQIKKIVQLISFTQEICKFDIDIWLLKNNSNKNDLTFKWILIPEYYQENWHLITLPRLYNWKKIIRKKSRYEQMHQRCRLGLTGAVCVSIARTLWRKRVVFRHIYNNENERNELCRGNLHVPRWQITRYSTRYVNRKSSY